MGVGVSHAKVAVLVIDLLVIAKGETAMVRYVGIRDEKGHPSIFRVVGDEPKLMQQRTDLIPAGTKPPEWGYRGNGPMRAAVMILADHFGDDDVAKQLAAPFVHFVLADLPATGWELNEAELEAKLENIMRSMKASLN
jgi:hypothetical protein